MQIYSTEEINGLFMKCFTLNINNFNAILFGFSASERVLFGVFFMF